MPKSRSRRSISRKRAAPKKLIVRFRRDRRGRLSSIAASGHAGWAEEGSDIVCAAVSALLQAVVLGLDQHAGVRVETERSPGKLSLSWPANVRSRDDVVAIVRTAELALEQIAMFYGEHVRCVREPETPR